MINSAALTQIAGLPGVRTALDKPSTYVIVRRDLRGLPAGWHVTPVLSFTSYAAMSDAVRAGTVPESVKTLLYDDERWSFTPVAEQKDPAKYLDLAGALARAHGFTLIAAPAVDLAAVAAPGSGGAYPRMLASGIYAAAARSASVVDVQAQGSIAATGTYAGFVRSAAAQARAANPAVVVLAGVSTNPAGAAIRIDQLLSAVAQTHADVSGYWLNIPQPGPYCPRCASPKPGLAAQLLNAVG